MEPAQLGIFQLYTMYLKAKEALAKGDFSTLATLAAELLNEAARVLPKGKAIESAPTPGDLMPLTLPTAGNLIGWLEKAIAFGQLLKQFLGR